MRLCLHDYDVMFCIPAAVPDSVVVSCHSDTHNGVKPGEVAFRLHFEAEHSNVLLVTAELLTGCLSRVEVLSVNQMQLVTDVTPDRPSLVSQRTRPHHCSSLVNKPLPTV